MPVASTTAVHEYEATKSRMAHLLRGVQRYHTLAHRDQHAWSSGAAGRRARSFKHGYPAIRRASTKRESDEANRHPIHYCDCIDGKNEHISDLNRSFQALLSSLLCSFVCGLPVQHCTWSRSRFEVPVEAGQTSATQPNVNRITTLGSAYLDEVSYIQDRARAIRPIDP